jgi:hypothetical protein
VIVTNNTELIEGCVTRLREVADLLDAAVETHTTELLDWPRIRRVIDQSLTHIIEGPQTETVDDGYLEADETFSYDDQS